MRVIHAIREIVKRYPDNPAVSDPAHTFSYKTLWQEALRDRERLPSGTPAVLIQKPRSCELVVSLLAAWMAELPPLLLDPATPAERVREIAALLNMAGDAEYLVTTSGSGGRAKIVAIGSGSLRRVLSAQIECFAIDSKSKIGWILSPGFDASLSDIGTALCAGAHLICDPEVRPDRLSGLTHLDIPPSLLQVFAPSDLPHTLQTLIVGGEASPAKTLREWSRRFRVMSVYGPAETTICSSLVEVDEDWDRPYLGQPLPGVLYRVEEGELLIGGPTVGLGYLGSESRSSFFASDGVRWYRTGDLVGQEHPRFGLSFVGRKDRQVQLRGQRFEPEEVERRATSVLNRPVACEVWNGQVVLFWEAGEDVLSDEERLKRLLPRTLMPGWLPQHYLGLSRLPRSNSRKIDREELRKLADRHLRAEMTSLERLQLCVRSEPPRSVPARARVRPTLLLTGASGRLGQALKPYLESQFRVWALQRGAGESQTLEADLTQPDFGLCSEQWDFLEREVEIVLHLAARVDLSADLETLRSINVRPLRRLALLRKPVHYASTLAVSLCTQGGLIRGGYPHSKWLAEQTLRDIPGLTLRYGHLIAPPRGDELLVIVIRGLLQLGYCPVSEDSRLCFDWTPMEWAVEQTIRHLAAENSLRKIVSIRGGLHFHLNDLAEILHQEHGVSKVTCREFEALRPASKLTSLARQALRKCTGELENPAFDLFLLGNSEAMLQTSSAGPREELQRYVATVAAAAESRSPEEAPARIGSPTRPFV